MQLSRGIKFHGTRDLNLVPDQEFIGFAAYVGYESDVDYVLVAPDAAHYEIGTGKLGVGGIFTRNNVRSSSTGDKVAFSDARHLLVLSSREEAISYKASDQTGVGTVFEDVTDTGLWVAANTVYEFEFHLICDADLVTTSIHASCNGPASPTALHYSVQHWTATLVPSGSYATAYDTAPTHTNSQGTDQAIYTVKGILRNGVNAGTLIARIKREAVLGSTLDVRAGSFGKRRLLRGVG